MPDHLARYLVPLCCALIPPPEANGQVPFEACHDREDRAVQVVVDNNLPYAGLATEAAGKPVIFWNKKANRYLSPTEQLFIYLHECAHHRLGHIYRHPQALSSEVEADCWAIQRMVDGGTVRLRQLTVFEQSRRTVPPDAFHLGGEAHIQSLARCLKERTDQRAWTEALQRLVLAARKGFVSSRGGVLDSSSTGVIYESLLDPPGTFDCEVIAAAVRCTLFAAPKVGPAEKQYKRLVKLVRAWLPLGWTSVERAAPREQERTFLARDEMTGTLLSLVQSGARVYFLLKRAPV